MKFLKKHYIEIIIFVILALFCVLRVAADVESNETSTYKVRTEVPVKIDTVRIIDTIKVHENIVSDMDNIDTISQGNKYKDVEITEIDFNRSNLDEFIISHVSKLNKCVRNPDNSNYYVFCDNGKINFAKIKHDDDDRCWITFANEVLMVSNGGRILYTKEEKTLIFSEFYVDKSEVDKICIFAYKEFEKKI